MDNYISYYHRANNLIKKKQYEAARRMLIEVGSQAHPNFDAALQELRCSLHVCDWSRYDYLQRLIHGAVRYSGGWAYGSTVLASPYFSATDLRVSADRCAAMLLSRRQHYAFKATNYPSSGERKAVRIGFLGRQFWRQPLVDFVVNAAKRRGGTAFQYIAYDMAPESSALRQFKSISEIFDIYIPVPGLEDAQLAAILHKDKLDVLVFMQGLSDPHAGVLAYRPASCILGYPVYPGSLGALVDGLIVDNVVVPHGYETDFSEKVLRVNGCYRTRRWKSIRYKRAQRIDHSLPTAACVLAYLGPSKKITPNVFDHWCTILRRFPGCVLWLIACDKTVIVNLSKEAAIRGVCPDRLIFATELDEASHRQRWTCVDIALDTYPYNSFSNTHDALNAGVPVVTWSGETMASRISASLLSSISLTSGVATSGEMYQSHIGNLISNPNERKRIRTHLLGEHGVVRNDRIDSGPSFDAIWEQARPRVHISTQG